MKPIATTGKLALLTGDAMAETVNFDNDKAGSLPAGWSAGVTGRGAPRWAVEEDPSASSKPNVLKQSGSGTFPWCVRKLLTNATNSAPAQIFFKNTGIKPCTMTSAELARFQAAESAKWAKVIKAAGIQPE